MKWPAILLLMICGQCLFAQSNDESKEESKRTKRLLKSSKSFQIHGGPRIGFNVPLVMANDSKFYTDLQLPSQPNILLVGGFAEFSYKRHLGIQLEATYTQNAYSYDLAHTVTETINYLNFPVLVKAKFGGFAVLAGYQVSKLYSAYRYSETGSTPENSSIEAYTKSDEMYRANTGAIILGAEVTLRPGLGFFIRYSKGKTISVTAPYISIFGPDQKIVLDCASAGMHFAFGRRRLTKRERHEAQELRANNQQMH